MGLLDGLKNVLGMSAEADATRDADPDDLWGMSTAYVTMEADLGLPSAGEAALCFSGVDSTDFADVVEEVHDILEAGKVETGTETSLVTDDKGYEWVVFEDDDVEDLVTSIHFAADTFIERGYGSRLLAALFAFDADDGSSVRRSSDAEYAYWVYSFRRGAYYPFVPLADHERDSNTEFKLESVLDGELGVEDDKEYWYPLWPDRADDHPWE